MGILTIARFKEVAGGGNACLSACAVHLCPDPSHPPIQTDRVACG